MKQFEATINDSVLALSRFKQAALDFVLTEIQLGLTFANLVVHADSRDSQKTQRNTRNARSAYENVLRFQKRISFTPKENEKIEEGIKKLRTALQKIQPNGISSN